VAVHQGLIVLHNHIQFISGVCENGLFLILVDRYQ